MNATLRRQVSRLAERIAQHPLMRCSVVAGRHQFEVVNVVVGLIAVTVMNLLFRPECSPQVLLHDQAMLKHIPITVTRPTRIQDEDIATAANKPSAIEVGIGCFTATAHGIVQSAAVALYEPRNSASVMLGQDSYCLAATAGAMMPILL